MFYFKLAHYPKFRELDELTQRIEAIGNGWRHAGEKGPCLFVFNQCRQFIRTVPALPRDEVDMDDVASRAEDHVGDETRCRLLSKERAVVAGQI